MKMAFLTYMFCFNSKENSSAKTRGSSISMPKPGQHISIRTFRELKVAQMLKNTWKKTETSLIMENSKLMVDQVEEVSNLQTTLMPKQSMQEIPLRRSLY
ncbi:AC4 [Rhynchosia yellow mosaic India virus]|uniref:AC4 n=1 Tax=Rhynchosia yellow mosaic India virus TaxID=935473 RepID=E7CWL6_9GEMI|nr:AC4 [Rhynchosia yellow mosaic India virus]ADU02160.1 AC4 [Rhynchosia yellow mosaic India virus]ADU02166.1 PTGS suppressor [Rhynchosia yellow mosaic India virus]